MTNPPVPATSLDVEACVRLLTLLARDSAEDAAKADREYAMADKNTQWAALALKNRDRCYAEQALLGALASALPGMGKDSDEFREACRAGGIACAGEREAARDEGRLDDARRWGRFAEILHARVGANR